MATTGTSKPGDPVNINYTVQQQPSATAGAGSSARTALAMSKPAMMGVGLLGLGTLAVGLFSAFRVPGLNEQIEDLESEVDRLEVQVAVLSFQNDRFEELNKNLNDSLQELAAINDDLNTTATKLEEEVSDLNATVNNLTETVNDLEDEEKRLEESNDKLNETKIQLQKDIVELKILNETWTDLNNQLENNTKILKEEVDQLEKMNDDLQNITDSLNAEVLRLNASNLVLEAHVGNLDTIQAYLVTSNTGAQETLDQVIEDLDDTIIQTRSNTFKSLSNYYRGLIGWDCLNEDIYHDRPWYLQQSQSIYHSENLQSYTELLALVNVRLLEPMCLGQANFERFLTYNSFPQLSHHLAIFNITYDQVTTYTSRYARDAIEFYNLTEFGGCQGLCNVTREEWEAASFDCTLLPRTYVWVDPRQSSS